jgi:CBS domain-containing protein
MDSMTIASLDSFGVTMRGLEAGLRVQHIAAFDLKTCRVEDSVSEVMADGDLTDFDQIPVRDDGGRVVGVLTRTKDVVLARYQM